jgi:hypothetical protein
MAKGGAHPGIAHGFEKCILPFSEKCLIHEIKRLDLLEIIAGIEYLDALTVARSVRDRPLQQWNHNKTDPPARR